METTRAISPTMSKTKKKIKQFNMNIFGSMTSHQLFDLLYDEHVTESTNFSYPMKQVLPALRKYFSDDGFLSNTYSTFRNIQGVPFAMILTKWGLCLNFNLAPIETMLHIDK